MTVNDPRDQPEYQVGGDKFKPPFDRSHNGKNSVRILKGVTITGAKGGNVALASVIAALVKLGATDSTTA